MSFKNFAKKRPYKGFLLFLLAPLAFCLNQLAYQFPWAVDNYYTGGIYHFFASIFGRLTSLFPFSLAQFLIAFLLLLFIGLLVRLIVHLVNQPLHRKKLLLTFVSRLLGFVGVGYFLFVLLFGLNYARPSYSQLTGLDVVPSSVSHLRQACLILGQQAGELRSLQEENRYYKLSTQNPYTLSKDVQKEFATYGENNPLFKGYYPRPKPVIFSKGMSYLDITGIYFPFTFEGNINVHVPEYLLPATMLHELAHFKGFTKESDANFIAYLVGQSSPNPDTGYSSTMLALVHSINAYYKAAGPEAYQQLLSGFSPGVLRDLSRDSEYWRQFQTPVAQLSRKVNDSYLKSHGQSMGIQSYGQMVDLVLAHFRQQGLL